MSLLANSNAIETGGYQISRSVRLRASATPYFDRTPASTSGNNTWTFSCWVKRGSDIGSTSTQESIMGAGDGGGAPARYDVFGFYNDTIQFFTFNGSVASIYTTAVYRDPSAWYHLVCRYDDTQSTASNRVRIYVNGVLQTLNSPTYPNQNYGSNFNTTYLQRIASNTIATNRGIDGYLAEVIMVSGQSLDPSSFGQTDANTGVWVAKKYNGTYGTNGFYLNFSDNSAATATTIGKDYSGNGNNWTPNNISVTAGSTYDSMLDVPAGNGYADGGNGRGNYCVLNPLDISGTIGTYASGNLNFTKSTAGNAQAYSSFQVTSGKWYCEVTMGADIFEFVPGIITGSANAGANRYLGQDSFTYAYYNNGQKVNAASYTAYGNSYTTGNVIGIILDADNGKLYFSKDGVVQNSGDPVGGTGFAFSGLTGPYRFAASAEAGGTSDFNFGQRPFSYTPPTGFKALNTTNLTTPTIGATSTTQANDYFDISLYTGTGSSLSITGLQFQPDWVWIKGRSGATDHGLYDAVRGVQKQLESNTTTAETTETTGLTAFNSDGFTVGALAQLNTSTATYVAWNWKANGAGSTNTAGSITSTVSANTTSGFSVVTWTAQSSGTGTVGHGLGVAPNLIIVKSRTVSPSGWNVYHSALGATKVLYLNATDAAATSSGNWNNTEPTSTVFTSGTGFVSGGNMVTYCFAAIPGYSAFGSFTGNGSADGPFVYTGFRPTFVMAKLSSGTGDWNMVDDTRQVYNDASGNPVLRANLSSAEEDVDTMQGQMDLLSNGFKLRSNNSSLNSNGGTIIYAAFAESPFKFSNAR